MLFDFWPSLSTLVILCGVVSPGKCSRGHGALHPEAELLHTACANVVPMPQSLLYFYSISRMMSRDCVVCQPLAVIDNIVQRTP